LGKIAGGYRARHQQIPAGSRRIAFHSPALGRFEGRNAIRNFFRGASGIFSFAIHYSLNGHIDHETYARVAGIWMFRHKRSESLMSVPFETGWATARFA
jgi:hypothetical protein